AAAAWPERLPAHALWNENLSAIAAEPLLRELLVSAPVLDLALERFLTMARAALLEVAGSTDAPTGISDNAGEFFCALARQCLITEYVFAQSDDEAHRAEHLRNRIGHALASGAEISSLELAAVAAYCPLHKLAGAQSLLDRPWSAPLAALVDQQVREPFAERQI